MSKIPYVNLSDTINTHRLRFNELIDSVGDLALLTTDVNTTIVASINTVDSNLGTREDLETILKTDIVTAINELDSDIGPERNFTNRLLCISSSVGIVTARWNFELRSSISCRWCQRIKLPYGFRRRSC
jgi:hypothetical protein